MIRTLITLGIFLMIGLVGYNFYFGTAEEKEKSGEIIQGGKNLVKGIGSVLKSEKNKFDNGKYDEAMSGLGNFLGNLKDKIEPNSYESADLQHLEIQQEELQKKIDRAQTEKEKKKYRSEFKKILEGAEALKKTLDNRE